VSNCSLIIIHAICKNKLTESLVQCVQNNVYNFAPYVDHLLYTACAHSLGSLDLDGSALRELTLALDPLRLDVVETGLEERARRNEWSPTKAGLTVGRE
jgi:hypothetical protein